MIQPTNSVDPNTMAKNWGPGVRNNADKWLQKYLKPKRAFNATPDVSQSTWAARLDEARAANRYRDGMANADLAAAGDAAEKYGKTNFANAGSTKDRKYASKAPALAAAINDSLSGLHPRGTDADNDQRMLDFARKMRTYKGKI